jgi:two-component system, NarL family, response regulator LiaR
MTTIRLVLVDDHKVVRRGLRTFLESFPDLEIAGEASSGEEVMEKLESWLPDLVLMDLLMPGGMDGIETTRRIRALAPHTQVVVLTAYTDDARVLAALRAGAIGYVCKDADPALLLEALRAAARGQSMLDPSVAGAVLQDLAAGSRLPNDLTERELEVLHLLARGLTNREIAAQLVVGEETVKTHVGNLLAKLHLAHRTQAMLYALKKGLLSLDEIELR